MNIEFTDRYGGNVPSWLRGCFGPCEAMGFYPVNDPELTVEPTDYERSQINERIAAGKIEPDGWYFIKCPECHGSGRCSWFTTIKRIPKWIWRGVYSFWQFRPSSPMWQGHSFGTMRRWWVSFKVAFLADLGVRM